MMIDTDRIIYEETKCPTIHRDCVPVDLSEATMQERCQNVLQKMREQELSSLLVYADREHGGNFSYLTGFAPRFEESLLVLHQDGQAYLMLGNEMLRMNAYSRLKAVPVHTPHFSLPNQPMETEKCFRELLRMAGLSQGKKTGIAGWKLLRDKTGDSTQCCSGGRMIREMFDVPSFIVDAVRELAGVEYTVNATGIFIDPKGGVRTKMNANEIAHYEYGACLASVGMADLLEELEPGKTELELAGCLEHYGQPNSVQTICATGERFTNAVVSPRNKKTALGDRFSATIGYHGGLTNRSGYLASSEQDILPEERDYMNRVAIPYFAAMASWYTTVGVNVKAADIYDTVESVVPQRLYGWTLNPGHYTADEEWLSSPFTPGSDVVLDSGMLLQMDIILKVDGFGGCNGEDGVAIMDESLQKEMREQYPQTWSRFVARQKYVREVLGIPMKDEVFPMSDLCGYLRPFLLDKKKALKMKS